MPRVTIAAKELPIEKVFCNDFVFQVPVYQRPYSWTTEESSELFDDIKSFLFAQDGEVQELDPYFLGSVVLIKGDDPQSSIIDGQQRLTTLTILLSALRENVPNEYRNDLTVYLYERGNRIAGTPDRYRLLLRSRDALFFQQRVQVEGGLAQLGGLNASTLSDSQINIRDNTLLLLGRVRSLAEEERIRLAQYIVKRCYLVVVTTPDLDSAHRIFSILNDRGLDLSHTDILKSEIIGAIPDRDKESYAGKWETIEDEIGREDFQEVFAHIRTVFKRSKLRGTILKEFRESVRPTDAPQRFIDEVLIPYCKAYETIKHANFEAEENSNQINALFKWLNRIDNFDWVPGALLFYTRVNDSAMLLRFFTFLERLAAGLMILRANVNERIERYSRILTAIENGEDLFAETSALQLSQAEKADISAKLNGDVYLMDKVRLYVLLRTDSLLAGAGATYQHSVITVEHVLPQTPRAGSQWLRDFPNEETRNNLVHKLGNLVLLARNKNSQARNFDFEEKKRRYFAPRGGVSPFALTTQVLAEQQWTPDVIMRRQRELVNRLAALWSLN